MKKLFSLLKLILIQLIILFVLLEVGTRIYRAVSVSVYNSKLLLDDDTLGWRVASNYKTEDIAPGFGKVRYTTQRDGFRVWGDAKTKKIKVFFIGDSFSQARGVGDGNCLYDAFKKQSDSIEVFAYGCGGYGSLQESLLLEKYIKEIDPDIIVWQFCLNDIKDNSYDFDAASIGNQLRTRPYLVGGKVEQLFPKKHFGWVFKYSKFLQLLSLKINAMGNIAAAKDFMEGRGVDDPLVQDGLAKTHEIMRRTKKIAGNKTLVAFSANSMLTMGVNAWANDSIAAICKQANIPFIAGVTDSLYKHQKAGEKIDGYPPDGHWNARGHAIAGKIIYDYIKQKELLRKVE